MLSCGRSQLIKDSNHPCSIYKATKSIDPSTERQRASENRGERCVGCTIEGSLATSMESINGGRVSRITPSTADQKVVVIDPASSDLRKAISLVLSRWSGLEMAVQNQWGGHDSSLKAQQLSADILSWFSQSKAAPRYVEDLENLLHERMILSFNTDIEDGSIEEVAEQLMIVLEEYLHGNH